jgi:hypothetical protein
VLLPARFSDPNPVGILLFSHSCEMTQPYHPPLFDRPENNWQENDCILQSSTVCSFLKSLFPSVFQQGFRIFL